MSWCPNPNPKPNPDPKCNSGGEFGCSCPHPCPSPIEEVWLIMSSPMSSPMSLTHGGGLVVHALGLGSRMKLFLMVSQSIFLASIVMFILQIHKSIVRTAIIDAVTLTILGLSSGMLQPVFFEFASELAYPTPESSILSVQMLAINIIMTLTYLLTTFVPSSSVSIVLTYGTALGAAMTLLCLVWLKEEYLRPNDVKNPKIG